MIFWPLIHTQFYNYLQIRLLQKSMWRRPDGKQKYGTAGHKVLPSPGQVWRPFHGKIPIPYTRPEADSRFSLRNV